MQSKPNINTFSTPKPALGSVKPTLFPFYTADKYVELDRPGPVASVGNGSL